MKTLTSVSLILNIFGGYRFNQWDAAIQQKQDWILLWQNIPRKCISRIGAETAAWTNPANQGRAYLEQINCWKIVHYVSGLVPYRLQHFMFGLILLLRFDKEIYLLRKSTPTLRKKNLSPGSVWSQLSNKTILLFLRIPF